MVVLPQPEGPSREVRRPVGAVREMLFRAWNAPKCGHGAAFDGEVEVVDDDGFAERFGDVFEDEEGLFVLHGVPLDIQCWRALERAMRVSPIIQSKKRMMLIMTTIRIEP